MGNMRNTINRKPQIRRELGEKANKVLYWLDQRKPFFEKSSYDICNYLMQYPRDLQALIEYRNLTKLAFNSNLPETPYYGYKSFEAEARDLEQADIDFVENHIALQWDEARKNKYADRDSVQYERDYTADFIKCGKYPIIGNMSRKTFLEKLQQDLARSNHGRPILNYKSFVQTLYARADNGKMYRFFEIIKINNTEEDSGTMTKVPTFDFSVEVYALPGRAGKKSKDNPELINSVLAPDINNSTPILRFDSQKSGHINKLGRQHGEAVGGEAGSRFNRERLYKLDSYEGPHFHLFDRIDSVVYAGRPLSSNIVTLTQLINIGKKDFKDTSAFNGLASLFVDDKENVYTLVALRDQFRCSHNQLDSKERNGRKIAWENQLKSLRMTLKLIDKVLNIEPERTLEVNRELMLGNDYVDYEKMQRDWEIAQAKKQATVKAEVVEETEEAEREM